MNPEQLKEGVVCNLSVKVWQARAKLATDNVDKKIPKEIIRASQNLIEDKTLLKEIVQIGNQARYILGYNSLQIPIESLYFIPKTKIEHIDTKFAELQLDFNNKADEFVSNYQKLINKFKKKYPKYYEIQKHKYPRKDELRSKFKFTWNFVDIGVPDGEKGILPPSVYKREAAKFKNLCNEIETMAIDSVSTILLKRIRKLDEQCQNDSVNGHTINGLETFFERWDSIWEGHISAEKFKTTVNRLRRQLKNVSTESLKNSEAIRTKISGRLERAIGKIEKIRDVDVKRRLDI